MKHMMVDLETLDTRPSTVVLSIGAVVFDPSDDVFHSQYWRCTWQDQLDAGRTVSESTIRWWLKQSDEARAALDGDRAPLSIVLGELGSLYRGHGCERLWARGASFDISILEHAYGAQNLPWRYNAPRDCRTFDDLLPPNFADDIPAGVAHNALEDAIWQARIVHKALRYFARPTA